MYTLVGPMAIFVHTFGTPNFLSECSTVAAV